MPDTIYFNNLVIHGNPDTYTGLPYGKQFYIDNFGPFNQYKVNGVIGGVVPYNYTSHDGDPIMTMKLQLSDMQRTADKKATVQIDAAALHRLPNGYEFGYTFTIYANMIIYDDLGDSPTAAQVLYMFEHATARTQNSLFTKPYTSSTWSEDQYTISNRLRMQAPLLQGKRVYFVISNYSQCSCGQRDRNVPVFVYDISSYYPSEPDGYFWRMQQGRDPNNPDGSTKNWHLVRPFYICKNVPGVGKCWCNCEDETPTYGPNGEKLV